MERILNKAGFVTMTVLALLLLAALATVARGGPLDPPAAPGSTQENLIFQPTTGCAGFPIIASSATSGSWRLAQNITMPAGCAKDGIQITGAGNVSLDLGGFTVQGVTGSLKGIVVTGCCPGVRVRNGTVQGWGGNGIDADLTDDGEFQDLLVRANGGIGIITYDHSIIERCRCIGNGGGGISVVSSFVGNSIIRDNDVSYNTGIGIILSGPQNEISDNIATNNGHGITVTGNSNSINGNVASGNTLGIGIVANGNSNSINGNDTSGNTSGIAVNGHSNSINGNDASGNTTGIVVNGNSNSINGNDASGNGGGDGISVTGPDNSIDRNNASNNGGFGIHTVGSTSLRDTITNNTANKNSAGGINTEYGSSLLAGNVASKNTGTGITAPNGGARIDNNHADHNTTYGIEWFGSAGADTGVCIVIRNTADSNGTSPFTTAQNYPNYAGNGCDVAPITTAAAMTSPVGNISE